MIQEETQPLTGVARSGWSLAALPRAMRDGRVALNLAYRVDSLLRFKRVDLGFATIGLPQLRNDVKRVNTAFDPAQVLLVASEVRGGAGRLVLVRVRVDSPLGE